MIDKNFSIIKTAKMVAYTVKKHKQGYELLKNPKGTSPYEVNMIRKNINIAVDYFDESTTYERLKIDFSSNTPKKNKRVLFTNNLILNDSKTNEKHFVELNPRERNKFQEKTSVKFSTNENFMPIKEFTNLKLKNSPKFDSFINKYLSKNSKGKSFWATLKDNIINKNS